jgi:hypothetical protein
MGKSKRCSVCVKPISAGKSLCDGCEKGVEGSLAEPLKTSQPEMLETSLPEMLFTDDDDDFAEPAVPVEPAVFKLPVALPEYAVEAADAEPAGAPEEPVAAELPAVLQPVATARPKRARNSARSRKPGTGGRAAAVATPRRAARKLQAAVRALKSLEPSALPAGVSGSIAILEHALAAFEAAGLGSTTKPGTAVCLTRNGRKRWDGLVGTTDKLEVVKATERGVLVKVMPLEGEAMCVLMTRGHVAVAT